MIGKMLKTLYPQNKLFPEFQPVMISNSSNEPVYKVFVVSKLNIINFKQMKKFYKSKEHSKNIESNTNSELMHSLPSNMRDDLKFSEIRPHHLYVYLQVLPPEVIYKVIPYAGSAMGSVRPAAMIFFTDSNGKKWTRDPQGNLILLPKNFDVCRFCDLNATDIIECIPSEEMLKNYKSLSDLYERYKIQ